MNIMQMAQHANPGKIIIGAGALKEIVNEMGPRSFPLIVTDRGIADSGILDRLKSLFEEGQLLFRVFDETLPDPSAEMVEKAAVVYRESGCNMLIGLGGGSPMDVAKACGLLLKGGKLSEYFEGKPLPEEVPPIFAVPTTAGTGAEVSRVVIITDNVSQEKKVLRGIQMTPKVAILDPELLTTIPPKLAADTGTDALAHAVESYVSKLSTPFSEAFSLQALRLIATNLIPAVENPANLEATGNMLMASCMTGLAFANVGLGLVHALGHAVGARTHIAHGRSCALFMAPVMKFNAPVCEEKFSLMAQAMGINHNGLMPDETASEVIDAVTHLLDSIQIPLTLADTDMKLALDEEIVTEIMTAPPTGFNPRMPTREEVIALLKTAM